MERYVSLPDALGPDRGAAPDAPPAPAPLHVDEATRPANPETDRLLDRIAELERRLNALGPRGTAEAPLVVSDHEWGDESHEDRLTRLGAGPYNDATEREKLLYGHHVAAGGSF